MARLSSVSNLEDHTWTKDACDVRGWTVRTSGDDESIGRIDDVIVDDAGRAMYLEIELSGSARHVLLPVGLGRADRGDDVVWISGRRREDVEALPEWRGRGAIDAGYEARLDEAFAGWYAGPVAYERPDYEASWWEGPRGREGVVPHERSHARLRRLGELDDFEVADHDEDPRGWDVQDADGNVIGTVDELIVDASAMKARYLEVDTGRHADSDEERHVMVPVGYARLDEPHDRVILTGLRATDLARLPSHDAGAIEPEYEERLYRQYSTVFSGENRYAHPRYGSERLYAGRRDDRGSSR